jgi:hypothetical protein
MLPGLSCRQLRMSSILLITGPSVAVATDGEGSRAFRERMGSAREAEFEFPYPENPPKVRKPVAGRLKLHAYGQYYDPKRLPSPESAFDYPVKAADPPSSIASSVGR